MIAAAIAKGNLTVQPAPSAPRSQRLLHLPSRERGTSFTSIGLSSAGRPQNGAFPAREPIADQRIQLPRDLSASDWFGDASIVPLAGVSRPLCQRDVHGELHLRDHRITCLIERGAQLKPAPEHTYGPAFVLERSADRRCPERGGVSPTSCRPDGCLLPRGPTMPGAD